MANPRTGVGQIYIGTTYEAAFGVVDEADEVFTLSRFSGTLPSFKRASIERPDSKQGIWRNRQLWGNTDCEFEFEAMFRAKGSATYNETGLLLKSLLGSQHRVADWHDALTFTIDTTGPANAPTATSCEILTSVNITTADIGALLYLPGNHIVRIVDIGVGLGTAGTNKSITWLPALAAGDVADITDAGVITAVRSFYFDGAVSDQSWTMFCRGEDTYDQILLSGGNGSAAFKLAPSSEKPWVTIACKYKFAKNVYASTIATTTPAITVPSSIAVGADDAGTEPVSLSANVDVQLEGYTGSNPDTTCTPLQFAELEFDLGYNLAKIEDGNKTNGIAGWQPTLGDGLLKGSVVVPFGKAWDVAAVIDAVYYLAARWGASAAAAGGIFLSKITLEKPEVMDRGGLQMMKIPFKCVEPHDDSAGAVGVAMSPIVIGQIG